MVARFLTTTNAYGCAYHSFRFLSIKVARRKQTTIQKESCLVRLSIFVSVMPTWTLTMVKRRFLSVFLYFRLPWTCAVTSGSYIIKEMLFFNAYFLLTPAKNVGFKDTLKQDKINTTRIRQTRGKKPTARYRTWTNCSRNNLCSIESRIFRVSDATLNTAIASYKSVSLLLSKGGVNVHIHTLISMRFDYRKGPVLLSVDCCY